MSLLPLIDTYAKQFGLPGGMIGLFAAGAGFLYSSTEEKTVVRPIVQPDPAGVVAQQTLGQTPSTPHHSTALVPYTGGQSDSDSRFGRPADSDWHSGQPHQTFFSDRTVTHHQPQPSRADTSDSAASYMATLSNIGHSKAYQARTYIPRPAPLGQAIPRVRPPA